MSRSKPSLAESLSRTETDDVAGSSSGNCSDISSNAVVKVSTEPSADPNDPLNWPTWVKASVIVVKLRGKLADRLKIGILTQASLLAAIGGLNTATINPALLKIAEEFDIDVVKASYQTTVCIALNGIAPWIWIPIAHKYGRRPVFLVTTLIAFVSILSCAYTHTYGHLLVARVFNGLFPCGFALGAAIVTDLFFMDQRGRAMGFFTVTVATGSHLAPIIGGLLGQYSGWRWIFKFLAIVDAILFLVALACLPETKYVRSTFGTPERTLVNVSKDSTLPQPTTSTLETIPSASSIPERPRYTSQTYLQSLRLFTPDPTYHMRPTDFVLPTLRMALYPSAIFPAIYYAAMYGFASILPAVTAAAIYTKFFHWNTLTIGLSYGASLTIGGILGEAVSGWVCDLLVRRAAAAKSKSAHSVSTVLDPEIRLRPIWAGEIITTAGLLMYGFTLQYRTHWMLPIFAMGMACFGLQIITTTTYTYTIDAHRKHSAEVAQLFNFVRQMFGMTFAFYVVRMGNKIGFQWTFLIFAICGGVLAFLPVVGLMLYGKRWRAWATEKWGKAD